MLETRTVPTFQLMEHTAVLRLTALWAFTEAGLGGVMHAFRSPFTGVFVGGMAVLLITLIASFAKNPAAAIMRSLLIVLIIKAMVSPHSPLPAYVAVAFQALLGAFLFSTLANFRFAAMLVAVFALLESALQKLLIMTIVFGNSLWESIDAFINSVLEKFGLLQADGDVHGSLWLVGLYLGVYFVGGVLIGWLAGKLPTELRQTMNALDLPDLSSVSPSQTADQRPKALWQRTPFRWGVGILVVLLALYFFVPQVQGIFQPLYLLLRVTLIIAVWYFLIAPLLMRLLRRFLQRKKSYYQEEVDASLALLPVFRTIAKLAWRETAGLQGWQRWKEFVVRLIAYALLYPGN